MKNGKPDALSQHFTPDKDDLAPEPILTSLVTIRTLCLGIERRGAIRQGKGSPNEDSLLTVLCDFTSNHMENRRCQHLPQPNGQAGEAPAGARSSECESPLLSGATSLISLTQTEELFDLIASSQSRRLDDQRASIGDRLGITIAQNNIGHLCEACNPQELSDDFFNMLIKY
ncbi:hypothetical protein QTP86_023514, partial [Hemibagrus guttatus]